MQPLVGDAEADRYLVRLGSRLAELLGERLLGAWLVNSAAWGDYLPGRSDLDVVVGVVDRLDSDAKPAVVEGLVHRSLPCPAPRLELVIYRRAVLSDPGSRPDLEVNLNTGSTLADHVTFDVADEPAHWFVLDLAAARERSRAILGPPLDEHVGPIRDELVIDALRASLGWYAQHEAEAPSRVLNACRAWLWLEERRWSSKRAAAEWAIRAGADRRLIELALARRRGASSKPIPPGPTAVLLAKVSERLERSGARADATGS